MDHFLPPPHRCLGWLAFAAVACSTAETTPLDDDSASGGKGDIIGDDDREPVDETGDPRVEGWADAIALVSRRIQPGGHVPDVRSLGATHDLCPGEAFEDEPVLGHCTAFLIADDLVATAAHCMPAGTCERTSFVFGFHAGGANEAPPPLQADHVYACREVIESPTEDAALVRLDRRVVGRAPLDLSSGAAQIGDAVAMLGHPSGIPGKVSLSGRVVERHGARFSTTLDSFPGHSGAPVLDLDSGEVVAVHVVGGTPTFVHDGSCASISDCAEQDVLSGLCRGSGELDVGALPLDAAPHVDGPTSTAQPPLESCRRRWPPASDPGGAVHTCECSRDCANRNACCPDFDDDVVDVCNPGPAQCGGQEDCRRAECTCLDAATGRVTETFYADRPCRANTRCEPVQSRCAALCSERNFEVASAQTCELL